MFLVQHQQPGMTSFVQQQQQPVASTQQWVLQQQQQGMGASNRVVLVNAGGGGLQYQQQAAAAQQQQYQQQQQQVRLAAGADATNNNQQTVVVNVNGTLQRGIVQNGAVYLLPNNNGGVGGGATAPQVVSSMPQAGATLMANRGQTLTLAGQQQLHYQQQHQQPMMVQQVLSNGQVLVSASAAMVANRGVQLQAQPQPQMQARFSPMPAASVGLAPQTLMNQQQQTVMLMNPGGANMATAGRVAPAGNGVVQMQARPQQQMQMPAQQAPARAAVGPSVLQRPAMTAAVANQTTQGLGANCVSANTASLMPRLGASAAPQAGACTLPAGSQPMTIAAALAALPSNPAAAAAGVAPTSVELASPVAPPGTPGMPVGAAVNNSAAGTIGAVINKLAAPVNEGLAAAAGTTVISGPPAAAVGISPLTSQPGTPSRSNSVGQHSSTSSSSSGSGSAAVAEADEEGKMSVMRMFAHTFIETGIGLEQALSMIQASDREMLAAAFAAEAAVAVGAKAGSAAGAAGSGCAAPAANPTAGAQDGLASLGGEQIVMPPSQGRASEPNRLQGLSNLSVGGGGAFDGEPQASTGQDSFSLGSWGFSLFSSVASDMGSTQTGSLGGHGDKVTAAGAPASATDVGTASLFANLHV